jgi:hypothetical protein
MAQSSGSNAYVAFIEETTYATTPATPELVGLSVNAFNVNLTKNNAKDNSIQIDGQARFITFGNQSVTGDIDDALTSEHSPMLESAMRSAFSTNTLKMGNTAKTFTFEQGFPSTSIYRLYTGIDVDKLSITVPTDGDVTVKYNVIGKAMTVGSATIDTSGGITAPAIVRAMRHNGGTVKEGGSTIAYITNIALNLDSGLTQNFVLGSNTIHDVTAGPRKVNGSFTALFESSVILNKFINSTSTSFEFSVSDGTNTYNFNMPNVNYTAATVNVANGATIPVQVTFDANYDPTSASTMTITKT